MKFELTEIELKRFRKFEKKMNKKYPDKINHIGFTFCFTPTGIGDAVIVKTDFGDEENITDFGSW